MFLWNKDKKTYDIIDPAGETRNIGDDLSGLDGASSEFLNEQSIIAVAVGGGWIAQMDAGSYDEVSAWLVTVDGSKQITTVTANYDVDGQLLTGEAVV